MIKYSEWFEARALYIWGLRSPFQNMYTAYSTVAQQWRWLWGVGCDAGPYEESRTSLRFEKPSQGEKEHTLFSYTRRSGYYHP